MEPGLLDQPQEAEKRKNPYAHFEDEEDEVSVGRTPEANQESNAAETPPDVNDVNTEQASQSRSLAEILSTLTHKAPNTNSSHGSKNLQEILAGLASPSDLSAEHSKSHDDSLATEAKDSRLSAKEETEQNRQENLHIINGGESITLDPNKKFDSTQYGFEEGKGISVIGVAAAPERSDTPDEDRFHNQYIVAARDGKFFVLGIRPDPEAPGKFTPTNEQGAAPARVLTAESPVVIGSPETSSINIGNPDALTPNGLIFRIGENGEIIIRNTAETSAMVLKPQEEAAKEATPKAEQTPEEAPRSPEAPVEEISERTKEWLKLFDNPDRVLNILEGKADNIETTEIVRLRELFETWQYAKTNEQITEVWKNKFEGQFQRTLGQTEQDQYTITIILNNFDEALTWLRNGHGSQVVDTYESHIQPNIARLTLDDTHDGIKDLDPQLLRITPKESDINTIREFSKELRIMIQTDPDIRKYGDIERTVRYFGNINPHLGELLNGAVKEIQEETAAYIRARHELQETDHYSLYNAFRQPDSSLPYKTQDAREQLERLFQFSQSMQATAQKAAPLIYT